VIVRDTDDPAFLCYAWRRRHALRGGSGAHLAFARKAASATVSKWNIRAGKPPIDDLVQAEHRAVEALAGGGAAGAWSGPRQSAGVSVSWACGAQEVREPQQCSEGPCGSPSVSAPPRSVRDHEGGR
ncbi:MAG TPA: hypothetical protein VGL18_02190, partial [Actinomycetota bacterium]